jgi:hypothetical protein
VNKFHQTFRPQAEQAVDERLTRNPAIDLHPRRTIAPACSFRQSQILLHRQREPMDDLADMLSDNMPHRPVELF